MVNEKALERIRVLEKKYEGKLGERCRLYHPSEGNHTGNARNDP